MNRDTRSNLLVDAVIGLFRIGFFVLAYYFLARLPERLYVTILLIVAVALISFRMAEYWERTNDLISERFDHISERLDVLSAKLFDNLDGLAASAAIDVDELKKRLSRRLDRMEIDLKNRLDSIEEDAAERENRIIAQIPHQDESLENISQRLDGIQEIITERWN